MTEFGVKQLSEEYLLNMHVDNKKWLISSDKILLTFNDTFVVRFLISYAEQISTVKNVPFYQELADQIIRKLSKTQINIFKTLKPQIMNNPTFVRAWFEQNYMSQVEEEQN